MRSDKVAIGTMYLVESIDGYYSLHVILMPWPSWNRHLLLLNPVPASILTARKTHHKGVAVLFVKAISSAILIAADERSSYLPDIHRGPATYTIQFMDMIRCSSSSDVAAIGILNAGHLS